MNDPTTQQILATLRTYLSQTPSKEIFESICTTLDQCASSDQYETAFRYTEDHIKTWPASLRTRDLWRYWPTCPHGTPSPSTPLLRHFVYPSYIQLSKIKEENALTPLDDEGLRILMTSNALECITHFTFESQPFLSAKSIDYIVGSPHAPKIHFLSLHDSDLNEEAATPFANTKRLSALRHLDLGLTHPPRKRPEHEPYYHDESLGTTGAQALATSQHLTSLRTLNLSGQSIGAKGVVALAQAPLLQNLESIDLSHNDIAGLSNLFTRNNIDESGRKKGFRGFLQSSIEQLMGPNNITTNGANILARSPHTSNLKRLRLADNAIGDEGVIALAHSPYLTRLNHLDLDNNQFGDLGLQALSKGNQHHLHTLILSNNKLTDRSLHALTSSDSVLTQLTHLDLSWNTNITSEGLEHIARCEHFSGLDILDLTGIPLKGYVGHILLGFSPFLKPSIRREHLNALDEEILRQEALKRHIPIPKHTERDTLLDVILSANKHI